MNKKNTFIKYGRLTKEETLVSINDKVVYKTFVLESSNPFPGFYDYYQGRPDDTTPRYIYLVTDRKYSLDEFTRSTHEIMKNYHTSFHAAIGNVTFSGNIHHIIRLRHLNKYEQIEELQNLYIQEGINFKLKPNKDINTKAIIELNKFFSMEHIDADFYYDNVEENHGYFYIPKKLTWKEFEDITLKVKHNIDLLHFDASLGFVFDEHQVSDLIRIYAENLNITMLKEIREKYIERF